MFQELKPKTESSESKAAFLGPQLWKSPERAQFSAMNFDEFLAENNFDVSRASSSLSGNDEEIRGQRVDTPNTKVDASR